MKVLMFAASLRKDSLNKKNIRWAKTLLPIEHEVQMIEFEDFQMPVYNGDDETATGVPEGAKRLGEKIASAEVLVISTPEYNGSTPGTFENAIDWVSRMKPMPWAGKHIFLMGASPGAFGAIQSLLFTRISFERLGAFVYPEVVPLPKAHEAFDAQGNLKDPAQAERVKGLIQKFLDWSAKK